MLKLDKNKNFNFKDSELIQKKQLTCLTTPIF